MSEEKKTASDSDSTDSDQASESKVDSVKLVPSRIDRIPSPDLTIVEQSEDSRGVKKADDQEQCGYEETKLR